MNHPHTAELQYQKDLTHTPIHFLHIIAVISAFWYTCLCEHTDKEWKKRERDNESEDYWAKRETYAMKTCLNIPLKWWEE